MEILIVFGVFGLLGVVMLFLNRLLGPRSTNPAKEQPFECGSPPLETEIKPYGLKFYLVALIFLVFDVEVVFFFPWALVFKEMGMRAGLVMLVYVGILLVGFVYAWRKGAFQWE
jgi:NADH-quinone oxidoreductase subunit A